MCALALIGSVQSKLATNRTNSRGRENDALPPRDKARFAGELSAGNKTADRVSGPPVQAWVLFIVDLVPLEDRRLPSLVRGDNGRRFQWCSDGGG